MKRKPNFDKYTLPFETDMYVPLTTLDYILGIGMVSIFVIPGFIVWLFN